MGAGGALLATASLITSAVFALTPDPDSSLAAAKPPAVSSAHHGGRAATGQRSGQAGGANRATTAGPVAVPGVRSINPTAPAPAHPPAATATAAAPAWTTSLPQERLAAPIVAMASGRGDTELLMVGSDGGVFPVGAAGFYGSLGGDLLASPVIAVVTNPVTGGYWLAGSDGGVFGFHAPYLGGLDKVGLAAPIVAMAATPDGKGYWLASSDGGVFAFGDAAYRGNLSKYHLAAPIVAMAATPDGGGYWLVSSDGGVFGFGDAPYHGNLSRSRLAAPIVSAAATPSGKGYWLASSDGGVFAFGDARFSGDASPASTSPIKALVPTADGGGYWLASQAGDVYSFGDALIVGRVPSAAAIAATALPPSAPAPSVVATGLTGYPGGAVGQDISLYQCHKIPGSPSGIGIVQVTGGALDNAPNPCYTQQAAWAGPRMSAYIYMDGLPSPAPASSLTGPAGVCVLIDAACESFNFGYNEARHWVAYSRSVGVDPKLWWLDVERYSGWKDTTSNALVIEGALQGLRSMQVQPGLYSTTAQWQEITGGLSEPGIALWTPGAGNQAGPGYSATSFCADPAKYSFAGGRLALVQFGYQGPFPGSYSGPPTDYDLDLACN